MLSVPPGVLPSGFALPPLPYLVGLVVSVVAVAALLYRRRPPVTTQVVTAFAPWMVAGAAGYALFQVGAVPGAVEPLFGSPSVYLSTFVVSGLLWAGTAHLPAETWSFPSAPAVLLVSGTLTAGGVVGTALVVGRSGGGLLLFWPLLGLLVSVVLAGVVWVLLRRRRPLVRVTGSTGALTLFGHAVDGVSTAIGTEVLRGFGEQTPLSRVIIEIGYALPTAEFVGGAWLFVLVKVALAAFVVVVLADYVEAEPEQGTLLLGAVAALGVGPGVHNLVLFAIA